MRFLVQKFGGTSVANPDLRKTVARKIIGARENGYTPVVVVSAMGRKGEPYATDSLLGLVRQVCSEVPNRELDLLLSCGEVISGVMMSATLQSMGCPTVCLNGAQAGIITDSRFNEARILKVDVTNILRHAREGKVVVVAGFQGISEDGEITTLGRGGSDTTAAALGAALKAAYIDIYTDVEGIMTADPRIVTDAMMLKAITYDEICHLAHEGAKVIHPRAVEIAMQKGVPLRVRSTFSETEGTLVTSSGEVYKGTVDIYRDRVITGIAQIINLAQIKVQLDTSPAGLGEQRRMFRGLALAGISIDFINILPGLVLFTIREDMVDKTVQVLENTGYTPEVQTGCAKVSAVGAGMAGVPGVIADIVEALTREQVSIMQCNDSHTTVWLLVKQDDMETAIRALHRQFLLGH